MITGHFYADNNDNNNKKNVSTSVQKLHLSFIWKKSYKTILLRLLQRSKKYRGHYSTVYHAMYTALLSVLCEEIRAFDIHNHVNCM